MHKNILAAAVLLAALSPVSAETYEIDPAHSSVGFKIKHLVSKVSGRFGKFSGSFDYEKGKPAAWKASAKIDAASIDTNNEKRDGHLKSADFFDVEKCPEMSFKSTKVTGAKGETAKLHGELTMHCVTKPVVLDLELSGPSETPMGRRMGVSATGKVNRKDFGIVWNKTLDSGGLMLGEDVDISIELEAAVPKKG